MPTVAHLKSALQQRYTALKVGNKDKYPVPPEWTDEGIENDWESPNDIGLVVARAFGLGPVRPILRDKEGQTQIIKSGDKAFMWDGMNTDIYEFACQDLGEIYRALHHRELQKLDKWLLKEVCPLVY
ncbi:hypothetical protein N7481_000708 [Penicillium waksmanii]|uniref:uncharacterized protein n=1 Tax=Penicillium waksmanii TaxID=69791 RepID=UPI0025496354|nr:uncharacterized protein N7481_000708 [Penicillium waksmanii]KAJ6000299.1 hypothetical protein N7481_000708 [Penicillium waksmanii]